MSQRFMAWAWFLCFSVISSHPLACQSLLLRDLRIDGAGTDLSRVVALAVASDGSLLVLQPDDGQVRRFDAKGRAIGAFGAKGEGPGEFRSLSTLRGWQGGAFWLMDIALMRISTFDLLGRLLRTAPVPTFTPGGGGAFLTSGVQGVLPDGSLIWRTIFKRRGEAPGWLADVEDSSAIVLAHTRADATAPRLLAWYPAREPGCYQVVHGRMRPAPVCASTQADISQNGGLLALASPGKPGSEWQVDVKLITTDGAVLFRRRLMLGPSPLSSRQADSIRSAFTAGSSNPDFLADYGSITLPNSFPAVTAVLVGNDSTVWVGLHPVAGQRPFMRLDAKGRDLGTVMLPEAVRLSVVSRNMVWGVEVDEDGVGSVVRYRAP